MASGVPVVATDVDGPSEVMIEGDEPPAGAVVPLDTADLLVEGGRAAASRPGLAGARGSAGADRAAARCAPPPVAGRL